ncbi:exosome complex component RRP41-like [Oppia nitens]|uniref:exosome complex component RRP41-like n=1 Tax=Oppia nitens TaxID=1686743 RepID=UPI0023DBEF4A|nr:exosome complex component RRP41-like [Oppia nitens]
MSSLELLSDEGLRCDGRRPTEVRKMSCSFGVFDQSDGSAYVELGNTRVLAAVYGPHDIRGSRSKARHNRAIINCQYSMATFSTSERKPRQRGDYRSLEITNNLREVFENAILTELFPHSQIDIFVEVLQSDGSNYSACVNAATLAVIHAGIPIKDVVCACSASMVTDQPIVDVNYLEESIGSGPILTIALLPKGKQILSMESSGRMHSTVVPQVMESAINGCQQILQVMKESILSHVKSLNKQ